MEYDFTRIGVALRLNDSHLQRAIKSALAEAGFRHFANADDDLSLATAVAGNEVDLLIADIDFTEGKICKLVHQIRRHEIGDNPFVVAMAIVDASCGSSVRVAIDSGVDDIVIAPLFGPQLLSRIADLSRRKCHYVVTVDYIGPDRRKKDRPDTPGQQKIPLLEVPNILRAKMQGGIEITNLRRRIESAIKVINEQKIERDAFQVNWLAERIIPSLEKGEAMKDVASNMTRLQMIAKDLQKRAKGSRYAHVAGLCVTINDVAEKLMATLNNPDMQEARYLGKLSQTINNSIEKFK